MRAFSRTRTRPALRGVTGSAAHAGKRPGTRSARAHRANRILVFMMGGLIRGCAIAVNIRFVPFSCDRRGSVSARSPDGRGEPARDSPFRPFCAGGTLNGPLRLIRRKNGAVMRLLRCVAPLVALFALAPDARAGLYYSGETFAELPSQWRGFLL